MPEEDIENMNETQARAEIERIETDPLYLNFDISRQSQRKELSERRGKLFDKLYPEQETEPGEAQLANPPDEGLVSLFEEGLEMRERKVREVQESQDERSQYLLGLIENNDLITLTDELTDELQERGATQRDLELFQYFREIIRDQGVTVEAKNIASDMLALVYGTKIHGVRK